MIRFTATLIIGLLAATGSTAAMRAADVVIATPKAGQIVEPDQNNVMLTGWPSDDQDARCCHIRVSYHHKSANDGKGAWVPFLTSTIEADNLVGGVVLDPDALIQSALSLVDPSNVKAYEAHRDELTTDQVSDWQIELISKLDQSVMSTQKFAIRGRPQASAPAVQFAPVTSPEDFEAPSTAPEPQTAQGPQAKALAAKLAALQAQNQAAASEGSAAITIIAPQSGVSHDAKAVPVQISITDADAAGQCCGLVFAHQAIVNLDDGTTELQWVPLASSFVSRAELEAGLVVNVSGAPAKAQAMYEAEPMRYRTQLKRAEAGAPESWRVEIRSRNGVHAHRVIRFKP